MILNPNGSNKIPERLYRGRIEKFVKLAFVLFALAGVLAALFLPLKIAVAIGIALAALTILLYQAIG